jgi:nicotinamidase-related amidase
VSEIKSPSFPWRPTARTLHLCLDMQELFAPDGPWPTPWMEAVLPAIVEITARAPARTVFTRFLPPRRAEDMWGTWRVYYREHAETTREVIDPAAIGLLSPLAAFVPPATVVDKPVYSAFVGSPLLALLRERRADGVIVTGAETDVCVLATVLDAVDLGYPVYVVTDAICSSTDASHDAVLTLYRTRYYQQVQTLSTEMLLALWPRG